MADAVKDAGWYAVTGGLRHVPKAGTTVYIRNSYIYNPEACDSCRRQVLLPFSTRNTCDPWSLDTLRTKIKQNTYGEIKLSVRDVQMYVRTVTV